MIFVKFFCRWFIFSNFSYRVKFFFFCFIVNYRYGGNYFDISSDNVSDQVGWIQIFLETPSPIFLEYVFSVFQNKNRKKFGKKNHYTENISTILDPRNNQLFISRLIFYIMLSIKTMLLRSVDPRWVRGVEYAQNRFRALENDYDQFWSCQIFIFTFF